MSTPTHSRGPSAPTELHALLPYVAELSEKSMRSYVLFQIRTRPANQQHMLTYVPKHGAHFSFHSTGLLTLKDTNQGLSSFESASSPPACS